MPGGQAIGAQDPGGTYSHDAVEVHGSRTHVTRTQGLREAWDGAAKSGEPKTEGLVHATASSIAHLVDGLDKLTAELAGALDRVFGPQPENASSAPERQGSAECGAHRAGHELERFERALERHKGQVRRAEQL